MLPGELYWVDYPRANGHEQSGSRPSLVLQDDGFAGGSPLVLTIPLTTASNTMRFPAVIPILANPTNGLSANSFILVFQMRATDRQRVRNYIGVIELAILNQVYDALDRLTGRSRQLPVNPNAAPPAVTPPTQNQRYLDL